MSEKENQAEFLRHFMPVQSALRGYLYAAVRNEVETDDLFQEVSLVLWKKFAEFDSERTFAAWAMGIARIQILRRRQTYARSRLVLSEEAVAALAETAIEEATGEDARLPYLMVCLRKLPPRDRSLMRLRLEKQCSMAEIGRRIQKSETAVQMILMRARRWLRECVETSMAQQPEEET